MLANIAIVGVTVLLSAILGNPVNFQSCSTSQADDDTRLVVNSLDISPWPIKHGNDAIARFNINLKERLEHGSSYDVQVRYRGYLVAHQAGDLCTLDPHLSCPKDPDANADLEYRFTMPNIPFSGDMELTIQIRDQSKQELCCLGFPVKLAAKDVDEEATIDNVAEGIESLFIQ